MQTLLLNKNNLMWAGSRDILNLALGVLLSIFTELANEKQFGTSTCTEFSEINQSIKMYIV